MPMTSDCMMAVTRSTPQLMARIDVMDATSLFSLGEGV